MHCKGIYLPIDIYKYDKHDKLRKCLKVEWNPAVWNTGDIAVWHTGNKDGRHPVSWLLWIPCCHGNYKQTNKQTDRQTDGQTNRKIKKYYNQELI